MKNGSGIEGKKEKKQVEPTSSLVRQEDTAAMEAMMGMDLDMDLEGGEDEGLDLGEGSGATARAGDTKAGAGASETKVKTEPGARKRRRVKKSKMEMDEKGYMGKWANLHQVCGRFAPCSMQMAGVNEQAVS